MKKNLLALAAMVAMSILAGCDGFGAYPGTNTDAGATPMSDAGPMAATDDSGSAPTADTGTTPTTDDAATTDDGHAPGSPCVPEAMPVACQTSDPPCSSAFQACDHGFWSECLAALPECYEHPDAGDMVEAPDAGPESCASRPVMTCTSPCGQTGVRVCMVPGEYGPCLYDGRLETCGDDAGPMVATDAGVAAMPDAYVPPAPVDAGTDAYTAPDAYVPPATTRTITFGFNVDPVLLNGTSSMEFKEEVARGTGGSDPRVLPCGGATTESGTVWYRCAVTRPVGHDFYFIGTFGTHYVSSYAGSVEGGTWGTMSSWNPGAGACGDAAATRGVAWSITASDGRSLLPPTGIPVIRQPDSVMDDPSHRACRGYIRF